jgi:glycosyltransferase involved in cell wall biosynthesis
MQKKTILHIIYNLGRGGAETMLVTVVKELSDYNNIIVTLFPENHFVDELKCDKYYCLNLSSIFQIPFISPRLKKIILDNNVDIVHSHLYWPTVLARMATPKKIPLLTTIHAFIATSVEYKKWYIRWLDRITYKFHKNIIITVAKDALDEYFNFLKVKRYKAYALHTFVDVKIFNDSNAAPKNEDSIVKLVTVGALRKQKNHAYLLEAFKVLGNKKFQLDIYGEGPLRSSLETVIKANHLNVNLRGEVKNVQNVLNQYDLYVMSSTFEGFSLSVLEAMAMRLPLLVSDIRSFREQCENTAEYFNLDDTKDFIEKLKILFLDKNYLQKLGHAGHERAVNNFTLEQHMQGLRKIYSEVLANNTGNVNE